MLASDAMPFLSKFFVVLFAVALQITTSSLVDTPSTMACINLSYLGGDSAHTREGKCEGKSAPQPPPNKFFRDQQKSKQVRYGPKLKYRVEYYRQCEPALMRQLGCDANPDSPCADGSYPLMRLIYAINGPRQGQLVGSTSYCSIEPKVEVPGAEQDVAKVTPERFRDLPILASTIISQPEGFSLRNGHAHMYAKSKPQTFDVLIFAQEVRIRALPVSYSWTYGDETTRRLSFPGGPVVQRGFDEATTTSHVYKETGDFRVSLSTAFRGEYSTEGGPWTPIPGVANVPGEPILMSVWRTKKILVAENCNENSEAPGCRSIYE
ncbi:hypothetical protein [Paeniglutamicibacter psychrophenolicus]|uniref:hypothetical protein n=1 Tax=Paeniglutamicibacter psychrophenolicus TaxID=257454 RepID=UPI00277F637B|nr:hypothetical protein [Paeniglutamicibacter psychrophenolicus]MDQ0095437.1 hypothetical protein [Paeniglutamicibacter psychrophenolicus]